MPEYLAPGVYVEETSFRAKSIEGVSTSTTAFVGPTRKGPVATTQPDGNGNMPAAPEMLTSFGDYLRIYGGLEPLDFAPDRPNYLANAVLNYFNEGGGRLYVARVATNTATAADLVLNPLAVAAEQVAWNARFPGAAGNVRITLREVLSPSTADTLNNIQRTPAGSLGVSGGVTPAGPARVAGATAGTAFTLSDGAVLRLDAGGGNVDVTFLGTSAEVTALGAALPIAVVVAPGDTLDITLNGTQPLTIAPAPGNYTPAELALEINSRLPGGYARLTPAGDQLVIGSDRRGLSSSVAVTSAGFGFAGNELSAPQNAATNNVADLEAVTAAEVDALLLPGGAARASLSADNHLILVSTATGGAATLTVVDATGNPVGTVSAHTAFGLPPGVAAGGTAGTNRVFYVKNAANQWMDGNNAFVVNDATQAAAATRVDLVSFTVLVEEPARPFANNTQFEPSGESMVFDELSFRAADPRFAGTVLAAHPHSRADALQNLVALNLGGTVHDDPRAIYNALFAVATGDPGGLTARHFLTGGTDGAMPGVGAPTDLGSYAAALEQLRGLEDISIIAAPGHSAFDADNGEITNYQSIQNALIAHVALPRAYRIAVLDTRRNLLPGEARTERARIDSSRAALYYPWVTVANPLARPGRDDIPKEINLPPSGFVCGVYARNDVEQAVAKSPANEVVRSAIRFESDVNFAHNQLLNPLGVNCLRYFPGRGYRVWGARTASSDPEWKYVNVRRFFLYLEASIDRGTQWAVFENNGPRLWANIRETVEAFLYNEWVSGNLLGATVKEAYFVRCDRSTMTQNDLDNGRLICLVGVAALKPAEFVIFRIGQKTADARS
jgi:phage tail sheath protein FI